jgi:hypothetical protein
LNSEINVSILCAIVFSSSFAAASAGMTVVAVVV